MSRTVWVDAPGLPMRKGTKFFKRPAIIAVLSFVCAFPSVAQDPVTAEDFFKLSKRKILAHIAEDVNDDITALPSGMSERRLIATIAEALAEGVAAATVPLGTPGPGQFALGYDSLDLTDGPDGTLKRYAHPGAAVYVEESSSDPSPPAGVAALRFTDDADQQPKFVDDQSNSFFALPMSIDEADLSDQAGERVLLREEMRNVVFSTHGAAADVVLEFEAFEGGTALVVVGEAFQCDLAPASGESFYLNGVAMAADEHIQNAADTLGDTISGVCVNLGGSLVWMWTTSNANWVEETP